MSGKAAEMAVKSSATIRSIKLLELPQMDRDRQASGRLSLMGTGSVNFQHACPEGKKGRLECPFLLSAVLLFARL